MTDVISGQSALVILEAGLTLIVTSGDVFSSGLVRRVSTSGAGRITNVPINSNVSFGPFPTDRTFSIEAANGKLNYSVSKPSFDYATQRGNVEVFIGSFTLNSDHNGKLFRCDDPANVTISVPNDLPQGFNCGFVMYSTGTVTISPATGAINRGGKSALSTQYQVGSLFVAKQVTANNAAEYMLGGDFA